MDQQEQIVINLIVNAGSARSSAIEAIQYAKAGDIEKAEESLGNAKEAVNEAHHSQTEMIQAEIRGEKAPLSLLTILSTISSLSSFVIPTNTINPCLICPFIFPSISTLASLTLCTTNLIFISTFLFIKVL